jgi:hypothetical protein
VATRRDEQLTYPELAARIEQALGVRPALSTLRAAAAVQDRGKTRTRVTASMPAPSSSPDPAGRTVFNAAAIDRWLVHHPRRRIRQRQERLIAVRASRRPQAVAGARQAGLSWQQIADALGEADGTRFTRQWAQQRYGRSR